VGAWRHQVRPAPHPRRRLERQVRAQKQLQIRLDNSNIRSGRR
jgi:hypothetical protein